uniref:C2H2-type domain-containing protein n=1 Tax=Aegilops tauschii TaxID=37682 RepID=M8B6Q8_AEGTA
MALVKSHHQMLASSSTSSSSPSSKQQPPPPPPLAPPPPATDQPSPAKRKRRPPGTPDPDAEVVALTPRTLLESDRCLHHDPAHALGDLVGIKKHCGRKHGGRRQWVCARCAKGYAVQSDYKAHLKTCGTRGHSCDCGRVFSRVESFIEHQDACNSGRMRGEAGAVPSALPVICFR